MEFVESVEYKQKISFSHVISSFQEIFRRILLALGLEMIIIPDEFRHVYNSHSILRHINPIENLSTSSEVPQNHNDLPSTRSQALPP